MSLSVLILQILFVLSIRNALGFLKNYATLPNSKGLEMAAGQSCKCKKSALYEVKLRFFSLFQLWPAAISKPFELGRSYIAF